MNFEPSETVRMTARAIDEFIEREVGPLEEANDHLLGEDADRRRYDDDGRLVDDYLDVRDRIRRKAAEAGFLTMHLPESMGGGGLSYLEYFQLMEHVHDRDPRGFHGIMLESGLSPAHHALYDDPGLRERYFEPALRGELDLGNGMTEPDHGSDVTWMDTVAERDGDEWVIDGTKAFLSRSAYMDAIIVYARTDGEDGDAYGISAFAVDRDNPGWTVEKYQRPMGTAGPGRTIGIHRFDGCRVPADRLVGEEGRGLVDVALPNVGFARLKIPASAVGRSQWMFERSVDYATTRTAFGRPIGERQFVQGLLADLRVDIEQVRWLYRRVAWGIDEGQGERWLESAAKLRGSELWNHAADVAVQVHGGAGYMKSLPFEAEYRSARGARIYDGTDEIHRRTIAREFLRAAGGG